MNEDELVKLLNQIMNADKTPEYEYRCGRDDPLNYLNANGIAPDAGNRWSTPTEICKSCLYDMGCGTSKLKIEVE